MTRCVRQSEALWLMQRAASTEMVARICQSFVVARSRRGRRYGEVDRSEDEILVWRVGEVQPEHTMPKLIIDTVQT